MTFIKKHFILLTGIISLVLTILSEILIKTYKLQYDDGGIGTTLVLGKNVYGFMFSIIAESLVSLEEYIVVPFGDFVVYVFGLGIFFALDFAFARLWKNKTKMRNEGHAVL